MRPSIIAGLLPALAVASPYSKSKGVNVKYTATFEDKNGNPVTPLGNIVGVYRGLNYVNFGLFQQAIEGEGLEPNTKPNTAVWGSATALVTGGTTDGTLTANYDGSKVNSFDLESLYFGCSVATQESTVNLPASCTVTFTAHDKLGNQIAEKTENFDGSDEMKFVQFGKNFERVYSVDFSVQGTLQNLLVVGSTDTLTYIVHQSSETQAQ